MASKMWVSLGTVVSPITGTFFSKIVTQHNHKYVIWYKGNYLIKPGDKIYIINNRFIISNQLRDINIIQIDKYSPTLWRVMDSMSSCPGEPQEDNIYCTSAARCIFETCPHGRIKRETP